MLLVPQKPTDRLEGWVAGEVGNYDLKRGQGVLNVPLSDTFKIRIGLDRYSRDGFLKNRSGIGVKDYNDVNYFYVRLGILADLTPDLENYTLFVYSHSSNHGYAGKVIGCDPAIPAALTIADIFNVRAVAGRAACDQIARQNARGDGPLDVSVNSPHPYLHSTTWQVTNTTAWKANDNLTIKNIASYGEFHDSTSFTIFSDDFRVPAGLPNAGRLFQADVLDTPPGFETTAQGMYTEELQFQGRSFDNRLTWVLGGYYEKVVPLGFQESLTSFFGDCPSPGTITCTVPLAFALDQGSRAKYSFSNIGLFAQGTVRFSDQLSLTGGFRYTWNKIDGTDETISYTLLPGATPTSPPLVLSRCSDSLRFGDVLFPTNPRQCHKDVTEKSEAPTWLVDLDYKPTNDILLYAKYSRGYREGGLAFTSPGQETWRPEKVDAYEIGAKVTLRGAVHGYFNVAGFYNDFTDQQVFGALIAKPNSGQLGGLAIINAGTSRIKGVEVEASIMPVESLRLDIGYTYLDTRVIKLAKPTLPPNSPYLDVLPTSAAGDPLTLSPKNRVTITGTYTLPVSGDVGTISLGATYTHTDSSIANGTELNFGGRLPATDLLNLNLNWENVLGQPFDLSVFGTNVTNQIYAVNSDGSFAAFGFGAVQIGQPRIYGVRLKFKFGE